MNGRSIANWALKVLIEKEIGVNVFKKNNVCCEGSLCYEGNRCYQMIYQNPL